MKNIYMKDNRWYLIKLFMWASGLKKKKKKSMLYYFIQRMRKKTYIQYIPLRFTSSILNKDKLFLGHCLIFPIIRENSTPSTEEGWAQEETSANTQFMTELTNLICLLLVSIELLYKHHSPVFCQRDYTIPYMWQRIFLNIL